MCVWCVCVCVRACVCARAFVRHLKGGQLDKRMPTPPRALPAAHSVHTQEREKERLREREYPDIEAALHNT